MLEVDDYSLLKGKGKEVEDPNFPVDLFMETSSAIFLHIV